MDELPKLGKMQLVCTILKRWMSKMAQVCAGTWRCRILFKITLNILSLSAATIFWDIAHIDAMLRWHDGKSHLIVGHAREECRRQAPSIVRCLPRHPGTVSACPCLPHYLGADGGLHKGVFRRSIATGETRGCPHVMVRRIIPAYS